MAQLRGERQQRQRERGEADHAHPGDVGERVVKEGSAEDATGDAEFGGGVAGGEQGNHAEREGDMMAVGRAMPRPREVEAQHEQRAEHEIHLGPQGVEEFCVVGGHEAPPVRMDWKTGDCSAGRIQSKSASGQRPR